MLKVVGATSVDTCAVEMDGFVPLSFRCLGAPNVPIYWRTGNFDTSLLEIGLHPITGAICSVTVTSIDPSGFLAARSGLDDVRRTLPGMPFCDIAAWPSDRFKDEAGDFTIEVGENSVTIWLAPLRSVDAMYEAGSARFGVDVTEHLCCLLFERLNTQDIEHLGQLVIG